MQIQVTPSIDPAGRRGLGVFIPLDDLPALFQGLRPSLTADNPAGVEFIRALSDGAGDAVESMCPPPTGPLGPPAGTGDAPATAWRRVNRGDGASSKPAFSDGTFEVVVSEIGVGAFGRLLNLMVRREDGAPVGGWDDLQRIKNELVSPDAWAFEVYPAEYDKFDFTNMRHITCFADPTLGREAMNSIKSTAKHDPRNTAPNQAPGPVFRRDD